MLTPGGIVVTGHAPEFPEPKGPSPNRAARATGWLAAISTVGKRSRARRALARLVRRDPAAAQDMARLVLHDAQASPTTRAHAVAMLGELVSDLRTDGDLWEALADPAEDVRWAAAVVLAPTGDRRVLLVLLDGLRSGDRFRRDVVAAALASMTEDQRSRLTSLAAG